MRQNQARSPVLIRSGTPARRPEPADRGMKQEPLTSPLGCDLDPSCEPVNHPVVHDPVEQGAVDLKYLALELIATQTAVLNPGWTELCHD